ncbi:histidine phosphatase family protein [Mucilaginibacter koreensis]
MKRLLLNRHAEAANPRGVDDFDRPLTAAGIIQAQNLAVKLQQAALTPDAWLISTALRAQATAHILTDALMIDNLTNNKLIYEATEQTLLGIINQCNNEYDFVALTGHNPCISYLFYNLCGEVRDVPPCTALLIEFEVDNWSHISANSGVLRWYNAPY